MLIFAAYTLMIFSKKKFVIPGVPNEQNLFKLKSNFLFILIAERTVEVLTVK